jgi:hypothetical protein
MPQLPLKAMRKNRGFIARKYEFFCGKDTGHENQKARKSH